MLRLLYQVVTVARTHEARAACARPQTTHVYTIGDVALLTGVKIELIWQVASNSDSIDNGEMINADDASEEGIESFPRRFPYQSV